MLANSSLWVTITKVCLVSSLSLKNNSCNSLAELESKLPEGSSASITEAQTKKIYATAKEKQLSPDEAKAYINKTFNKNFAKELTKAEASTMIEFLNEIKSGEGHLVRAAKEAGAKED